jgi:hypothetical protein
MDGPAVSRTDRAIIGGESLWEEIRRISRPIVVDIAVFVLILLALLAGFLGLSALKAAGYNQDHIRTFEAIHYWCYAGVHGLFGIDLLFKITLALFFRSASGTKAEAS